MLTGNTIFKYFLCLLECQCHNCVFAFGERGDTCLQSNSSLCFLATSRLSPGEAAGERDIIVVAVGPCLSIVVTVSGGNCFGREATFKS